MFFRAISIFFLTISFSTYSQCEIDILDYNLALKLYDSTNSIDAKAIIKINQKEPCSHFRLDLEKIGDDGKGMVVKSVRTYNSDSKENVISALFFQENEELIIEPPVTVPGTKTFIIEYQGIPRDGLVIGENKFGSRTFFGDNWPNRAHQWFPCKDHPLDKATITFNIETPSHYKVVANGMLVSEEKLRNGRSRTVYSSSHVLPTKVMVIGVANLVSDTLEALFPHVNWVYPENKEIAFHDMSIANEPLDFFIETIGPYPFSKLYNVQSTTRFGGMENAGCIFYDEESVKGDQSMEKLIAHEIAHQWFGNSASESDWQHIWLSEGFATYLANMYIEHKYGIERFNEALIKDRKRVINFYKDYKTPVVDTISNNLMYLLNPNSYQKGSWILHMIRNEVGDSLFHVSIQKYYHKYAYSNASTSDLIEVIENTCNQDFKMFSNEWLKQEGHPILEVNIEEVKKIKYLVVNQVQKEEFTFPISIRFRTKENTLVTQTFQINKKNEKFQLTNDNILSVDKIDPEVKLLFEIKE